MSTLEYMAHKGWRPSAININCIQSFSTEKSLSATEFIYRTWWHDFDFKLKFLIMLLKDELASSIRMTRNFKFFLHEKWFYCAWSSRRAKNCSLILHCSFFCCFFLTSHTMEMELLYNVKNIFVWKKIIKISIFCMQCRMFSILLWVLTLVTHSDEYQQRHKKSLAMMMSLNGS